MRLLVFNKLTLISIFLVVIAGGVVRMTGSGMGCPDWPKCFDCYIPPTSVDQLPANYKDIYASKRAKKIDRFAGFLTALGFEHKAKELRGDKTLLEEQDFNVYNTWTEYINRLSGVLAGLFILVQLIWLTYRFKKQKMAAVLALFLLLTTVFQAWFGAMVVATNIVPWVLTTHMLVAILMLLIQLHIIKLTTPAAQLKIIKNSPIAWVTLLGVLLLVVQTIWGTQVRQQIDVLQEVLPREDLMSHLRGVFPFHRSMAIALVLVGGVLIWLNVKFHVRSKTIYWLGGVIVLEALVGRLFTDLGMPVFLQPTHLLLSMILFSLMYYTFITTKFN